ncbi:hypothetical protein [Vibrio sp.]|uniref:hypothetical protein n=1 Tax=Vibrio sp. TaxID=678 RepID=UPI003D0FEF42
MSRDKNRPLDVNIAAQVAGAWSASDKSIRADNLQASLQKLDGAYSSAMGEMKVIRDFVGNSQNILGNENTKHGEIAEQVHVGVTRAYDVLCGRSPSATFENIKRTASVDYRVDGVDVQSKYIQSLNKTLDHILDHSEKYPEFAKGNSEYHIPKDYYQQLEELRETGQISNSDLSEKSIRTIQRKIDEIGQVTGRDVEDVIKPGNATYDEVQKGKIDQTLDSREKDLKSTKQDLQDLEKLKNSPSIQGLGKAAAWGAVAGGGVRLAQAFWIKFQEGKNPFIGDFTLADWQDVGIETGKGTLQGGIAGGTLYLLTNATDLAAPFAGAMVSGLVGIGDLVQQYHQGQINSDQFAELSFFVATDAAIVGLATVAGQAIIPIPMLGAFVGSISGKIVASALKSYFQNSENELIDKIESRVNYILHKLDVEHRKFIEQLNQYFDKLETLINLAFDEELNTSLRLAASVTLAETMGVEDSLIIRSTDDLDEFMMA